MSKPLFKIDEDSVVKGTADGHMYCTTTPDHPNGEVRKDRKKRYVYLHRALMELHLGRYLKRSEEVHHKNEDPTDNRISNLILMGKNDHARSHSKKKEFWKKSPRNKPGRKASAMRVIKSFLSASP